MRQARIALVAVVASFLAAAPAAAAELRIEQQPGSPVLSVVLDTQGEQLNAVEGTIDLAGGVSAVFLGKSVVPLWVERPSATSLRFSGVIPGGFEGDSGVLFELVPAGVGRMTIAPLDAHAYRNDGKGTETSLAAVPLSADIPPGGYASADTELPDFSEVRVARDPALFDGRWFVVFNAQDGGTGVARYEVAERIGTDTGGTDGLTWRAAESPALLGDQDRRSTVFVRAIDGAGNARIAHVAPEQAAATGSHGLLGWFVALVLLLIAVSFIGRGRKR